MALTLKQNLVASFPLVVAVLACTGAIVSTPACSGVNTGKVAQTVLDVGDAVCDALTANDVGNGDVQIVCKYINQADGIAHVFIAKVPAAQAARMGLRTPQTAALMASAPVASSAAVTSPAPLAPSASSAAAAAAAPAPSTALTASSKPTSSASSKPAAKK
jgi:hypothetical protein